MRPSRLRLSRRRLAQYALLFVAAALVVNALIGDRGLTALLKAKREHAQLHQSLIRVRQENARIGDEVRRLGSDPKAIELAARENLGLARKDELLFIVRDAPAQK
ncbi:MAG: septum formation initiator family protein [Vicinamibacterales bacterium]